MNFFRISHLKIETNLLKRFLDSQILIKSSYHNCDKILYLTLNFADKKLTSGKA